MTRRSKVLVVYGTRPEAIKMAPLVVELRLACDIDVVVAVTGQHREMLDQVNRVFAIEPAHDLNILRPRQTLAGMTSAALKGLTTLLQGEQVDAVVVQGDTTTAFSGALAAFYQQVRVVHLEAGLRTGQRDNPFPEEANRRLITQLADLHLAPTPRARQELEREGVDGGSIVVTGNTVIDALLWTVKEQVPYTDPRMSPFLSAHTRIVLITAHRRESWGAPMAAMGAAIARLARGNPDVGFVLPAHLNPVVREVLLPPLAGLDNVLVTEPLHYGEFCRLMAASDLILTDSGGVQEEAPSLGRRVLVMRETTERPEGVAAGLAELVGTDEDAIVKAVATHLADPAGGGSDPSLNPYGDGRSAARAAAAIRAMLGIGARLPDFDPPIQQRP